MKGFVGFEQLFEREVLDDFTLNQFDAADTCSTLFDEQPNSQPSLNFVRIETQIVKKINRQVRLSAVRSPGSEFVEAGSDLLFMSVKKNRVVRLDVEIDSHFLESASKNRQGINGVRIHEI
jgi:hypothetical protein